MNMYEVAGRLAEQAFNGEEQISLREQRMTVAVSERAEVLSVLARLKEGSLSLAEVEIDGSGVVRIVPPPEIPVCEAVPQ